MEASKLVKLRNPWGIKAWEAEGWSSTSKKWTEQLTQEMAYQNNGVIDRGLFFVTLQEYVQHFFATQICYNTKDQISANCQYNFDPIPPMIKPSEENYEEQVVKENFAFFKILVPTDLQLFGGDSVFSCSIFTGGNRLGCYHRVEDQDQFNFSATCLTLLYVDPYDSEWDVKFIKSETSVDSFDASLICTGDDPQTLLAGEYTLVVDCKWNRKAQENPVLREMML